MGRLDVLKRNRKHAPARWQQIERTLAPARNGFSRKRTTAYLLLAGFSLTSAFRLGGSFSSMANAWISVVPTFSEACVMASVHDQALVFPAIVVFSPSAVVYFPLKSVSV